MTIPTRPFDPAVYLDTDEARAAYLMKALERGTRPSSQTRSR